MNTPKAIPPRQPTGRWSIRILGLLIAAGVLIRIILALMHPLTFPDSLDYLHLAHCIERGAPYRVTGMYAKRLPGYPIFMAGVLMTDSGQAVGILIWQALISGGMIYLAWRLGRHVDPLVGLLSAAFVTIDPLLIGFSASYLSETIFTATLLFTLLIFIQCCMQKTNWWLLCAFAVLFVVDIYIRAEIALCIFPLLAYFTIAIGRKHWHRRALQSLLVLIIIFAGMMPWWVRNWELFHSNFFRFSTLEGISLYESVYHGATGGPRQSHIKWPANMKKLNESQRDNRWTKMAFTAIREHPWRVGRLAFIKIGRTWSPWLHAKGFRSAGVNALLVFWYSVQYAFAIIGLWHLCIHRRKMLLGVTLIPILYLTAMHALFLGSVRYRVPLIPLLCFLAAVGVQQIYSAYMASRLRTAACCG